MVNADTSLATGGKPMVTIYAGEIHVSRSPAVIFTLLGSCVAACLFDPVARLGGMNHILLPGRIDLRHFDDGARYGINAMERLINELVKRGADRKRLAAKVFGGASIIPGIDAGYSPGPKNAEFVLEFLRVEAIRVAASKTGGVNPVKVYFHSDTGEVFLKRLPAFQAAAVAEQESRYQRVVERDAGLAGDVTLFGDGERNENGT